MLADWQQTPTDVYNRLMMWMNRRTQILVVAAGTLALGVAGYLWLSPASTPPETPVTLPVTAGDVPSEPTIALGSSDAKTPTAEPAAPLTSTSPPDVPSVAAETDASTRTEASETATLPPLTPIIIKDHPVNTIPSEPEAPKPTGDPRLGLPAGNGKSIGQSAEVAFGPRREPAGPPPQRQFSDKATVTGPTTLTVGTVQVKLFGVAALKPSDRCGSLPGDSDCLAAARAALLRKIGTQGTVSCHVPYPRPGIPLVSAICLDPQGVDLGGFLIAEGLATADTSQSYDYVGAENVARTLKRGLWQYR